MLLASSMPIKAPISSTVIGRSWPESALVVGVNNGAGSSWLSSIFTGRGMPKAVPLF